MILYRYIIKGVSKVSKNEETVKNEKVKTTTKKTTTAAKKSTTAKKTTTTKKTTTATKKPNAAKKTTSTKKTASTKPKTTTVKKKVETKPKTTATKKSTTTAKAKVEVKQTQSKKEELERKNNDYFMFTMLLSVICVLAVTLKDYSFTLFNTTLTVSLLIVPIIIFVSNYITKKYGFKHSLLAIVISSLMIVAFLLLMENLLNQAANISKILGCAGSYFISFVVNLAIYYYIILNMTSQNIMIGLNYMFTIVLNSFLYLVFFHKMILSNSLWKEFTVAIIIQFLISTIFVYFDRKIERGI